MSGYLLLAIICGLLTGATLGAQPGVNGYLGKHVAHPLQASLISFSSGLLVLLVLAIVLRFFPRSSVCRRVNCLGGPGPEGQLVPLP